jgi:hypothetical protein
MMEREADRRWPGVRQCTTELREADEQNVLGNAGYQSCGANSSGSSASSRSSVRKLITAMAIGMERLAASSAAAY